MTRDADDVFDRLKGEAHEFAAQDRVTEAVAARDAAWREAVERVRVRLAPKPDDGAVERAALRVGHAAIDALLAAMEGA